MTATRYSAHSAYEDSGIASCPVRPAHWGISKLKFVSELNPSKSQVRRMDPQTPVTFLAMEAIGENGELDVSQERVLQDVRNGYTFLGEGDVCIAKITPCFENGKGAVISGTRNGVAFATTEVIPFRCKRSEDARFLYFLLTCAPFKADAEASMYGAGGQKRVGDSFVGNYSVVLPPPAERSQIAKFLDHETAKIDALIEKQQQLIELLKEKRQAIISQAVTKGLNPDAPMRDSRVEWLGEVPAHWEVKRLKHVLRAPVRSGVFKKKEQFGSGDKLVNVGDLYEDEYFVDPDALERVQVTSDERKKFRVYGGDLFFVRSSLKLEGVGRVACLLAELEDVVFECHVVRGSPNHAQCSSKFLARYLNSAPVAAEFIKRANTTTMTTIDQGALVTLEVPLPPKSEQYSIDEFLDRKLQVIADATSAGLALMQLLQERRTALISAAVTGKIDVRDWRPPAESVDEAVA